MNVSVKVKCQSICCSAWQAVLVLLMLQANNFVKVQLVIEEELKKGNFCTKLKAYGVKSV